MSMLGTCPVARRPAVVLERPTRPATTPRPTRRHHATASYSANAAAAEPAATTSARPHVPSVPSVPGWQSFHWRRFWRSTFEEEAGYEVPAAEVEGVLPADLEGTFFRAGPGCTVLPSGQELHPFDGHGMVARVAIKGGRAYAAKRYVRTTAFAAEVGEPGRPGAGVVRSRGFMTDMPGGVLGNLGHTVADRSLGNTSLVEHRGRLLATWEGGSAHALDPVTLETKGLEDVQGLWRPGQAFSAHPHFDPITGNTVLWGLDSTKGKLWIAEVDGKGKPLFNVEYSLAQPAPYCHDCMITDQWYVFYAPPLSVDAAKWLSYLAGANPLAAVMRYEPGQRGRWLLFPRRKVAPRGAVEVDAPGGFIWHFVNAFDEPLTGWVVVDAVMADSVDMGGMDPRARPEGLARSTLRRFTLNPLQRTTLSEEVVLDRHADFPQINPAAGLRPYRYAYLVASKTGNPNDNVGLKTVAKLDVGRRAIVSEWTAPEGCFVQEAVYAPRSGQAPRQRGLGRPSAAEEEDDGYLVTLMFDAEAGGAPEGRSCLLVFTARDPGAGPVAAVWLRSPIPCGFHNLWSGTAYV